MWNLSDYWLLKSWATVVVAVTLGSLGLSLVLSFDSTWIICVNCEKTTVGLLRSKGFLLSIRFPLSACKKKKNNNNYEGQNENIKIPIISACLLISCFRELNMKLILLISIKMLTFDHILMFVNETNFLLSKLEHERRCIISEYFAIESVISASTHMFFCGFFSALGIFLFLTLTTVNIKFW